MLLLINWEKPACAVIDDQVKDLYINFDWDPNSYILFDIFDYYNISYNKDTNGVYNYISKWSNIICVLIRTSLNTLKAFRQLAFINMSKNISLKTGKKPSLLI